MLEEPKQLQGMDELMAAVLDTSGRYTTSIDHYLNNKMCAVIGVYEYAKSDPVLNTEPFDELLKDFEKFRDTAKAYHLLLMEFSHNPGEIPLAIDKATLIQRLSKYGEKINAIVRDTGDMPPYSKSVAVLVDLVLGEKPELKLDLPFIGKLRDGSYHFPCPEQEVRDDVVKALSSLAVFFHDTCVMAMGTASGYNKKDPFLHKVTREFCISIINLTDKYIPAQDECGKKMGCICLQKPAI